MTWTERAPDPPMHYAELPARLELKPWIACHWHFRVAPGAGKIDHQVPPTGGVMLVVRNEAALLAGPRTSPLHTIVEGGEHYWGTHVWPGAARSLLGAATTALRERTVPAADVLGQAWVEGVVAALGTVRDVRQAIDALDAAWTQVTAGAEPLDERAMTAVFRILARGGEGPIAAVAGGLSSRQLRRLFRETVGLTPKELARVRRFRSSAVELVSDAGSWVSLAAHHGYADQSHLIREYRRLVGVTPTEFERHVRRIDHDLLMP